MSIADIIAAFLGFGLLHLRGHLGHAGWRWLFLVEVDAGFFAAECIMRANVTTGHLYSCARYTCICLDATESDADCKLVQRQKGMVHSAVRRN